MRAQSYAGSPETAGVIVSVPSTEHSMLVVSWADEPNRAHAPPASAAAAMTASATTSGRWIAGLAGRRRPTGARITPSSSSSRPAAPKAAAASTSETAASRRSESSELCPLMFCSSGESTLRGCEGVTQSLARAMQAEPHGGATRPERDCDLASRQALPGHEREKLPVGLAQAGERLRERGRVLGPDGRLEGGRVEVLDEPLAERGAPAFAPALIRDHTPRNAIEPGSKLLALRAAVEATPQRDEGLSDCFRRILGVANAPQRVATDRFVQLAIGRLEPLAANQVTHHAILHNRNMSGSGPSVSPSAAEERWYSARLAE